MDFLHLLVSSHSSKPKRFSSIFFELCSFSSALIMGRCLVPDQSPIAQFRRRFATQSPHTTHPLSAAPDSMDRSSSRNLYLDGIWCWNLYRDLYWMWTIHFVAKGARFEEVIFGKGIEKGDVGSTGPQNAPGQYTGECLCCVTM